LSRATADGQFRFVGVIVTQTIYPRPNQADLQEEWLQIGAPLTAQSARDAAGGGRRAAFLDLPPLAQEVMRAIFSIGKKKFTRSELAAALEVFPWSEPIETPGSRGRQLKPATQKKRKQADAWGKSTRCRAILARRGYILCEPQVVV